MNTQTAEALDVTDHVALDEPAVEAMLDMEPATAMLEAAARDNGSVEAQDDARLVTLLEGLLFAAGAPVPIARLVEALDGPDRKQVVRALELLGERLEEDGRGVRLVRVAGGYQLRTLAEHGPWIRRLLGGKPPRLSRALLETLAIIAYRQPCTKIEIEAIRGVDVDAVLSTLLERRMVRLVGRKEAPGRPILYGTTKEFLEVFSLPDLDALPPLKDLGELAEALTAAGEASADAAEPPAADGPAADAEDTGAPDPSTEPAD
jgi:segregation and condensation protein B